MGKLEGRVAVVTGGASGMGAETVRRFVREGARVVIADLLDAKAEALLDELRDGVLYAHTDVCEEEQVRHAIDMAVGSWGRLDCIFNNAGIPGVGGGVAEIPIDGYQHTLDVLVKGVLLGMKHAAPVMKRQRAGSIINTASVAGLRAGYGPHVYSAAKAAVIHLTRCVAMELGEWGVRVNCICPGGIVTPIFGKAMGLSVEEADRTLEAVTEALAGMQPIRRPGRPADIAAAALWLASEESSFVNGHALVVDGGLTGGVGYSQARQLGNLFRQLMGLPPEEEPAESAP
jgi:NAD(P)-dependent dehydrogenase (short-subunit alcohol dehydrogenase family)